MKELIEEYINYIQETGDFIRYLYRVEPTGILGMIVLAPACIELLIRIILVYIFSITLILKLAFNNENDRNRKFPI